MQRKILDYKIIKTIRHAKPGICSKCGARKPYIKRLARKYGVSITTIERIRRGEIYRNARSIKRRPR